MEDGSPLNMFRTLSNNNLDLDLMDGLFDDGCWLETTPSNFWQQQGPSPNAADFSSYFPIVNTNNISHLVPYSHQMDFQEEKERLNSTDNVRVVYPLLDECDGSEKDRLDASASSTQSRSLLVQASKSNTRLWIAPSADPNPANSVKNRLIQAFEQLKNITRDDFLIQIWLPVKREGKIVLSTINQPFSLDPKSKSLECYRYASSSYHFAAELDSKEFFGLPGRVFLKKWPEWMSDAHLLRREDYPRVDYALQFNVKGSLAIPVFERGNGACLGVVEIVTTSPDVNCLPEVDDVCKALEAVDLRSSDLFTPPKVKDDHESYPAEVAEIKEIVTSVCNSYNLPLAQTWTQCNRQDTDQCRYDENSACLSIVASASYVHNKQVLGYHEACCKHHLLGLEGVVGRALGTNQPCFATDISAFSETEYPFAYHAKMLRLRGAVAIRLRSIYTDSTDFIIEFLLPLGCKDLEQQKQIVSSILSQIQQSCNSLRFVSDQELEASTVLPEREKVNPLEGKIFEENKNKLVPHSSVEEATLDESSWIAQMMEAQQKNKGFLVSLGHQKEEPEEEFKVKTDWITTRGGLYPGIGPSVHKEILQDGSRGSVKDGVDVSIIKGKRSSGTKKAGQYRRIKAENTISLQVLRQYFAGSLKDAAANIGVCPTTLKRICRQHGISRWPSRKIKKVGHSLKKLQLVIDSVQGNEGAIQLSSFYTNFPELSSSNISGISSLSTLKIDNHLKQLQTQQTGSLLCPAATASKSTSSSSHSSGSSYCCSTEAKELNANVTVSAPENASPAAGVLKRALSDVKLHHSGQEDTKFLVRSHSHKIFSNLSPLQNGNNNQAIQNCITFRVKATFGEEKLRFRMPEYWRFIDLQEEISRRFNIDIDDINKVDLRYLDEDSEWILLTCNDDLEECIDIHRSFKARTIKLLLREARYPNLGSSLDSCGPS
ncbi:PB1 domain-containing protein/RWP-RK domain-containing protein [Heracleum sosnowskyi]|uniref:PB1 domain-containing protein/RWP-RK domain-containing protein n=1 Tax=Heracleum sosnowskyi TaxID=360622 RepID=A0AAD8ID06_9APIA|nr:PB1 domain-containing protein/RWP-RK domain-containing protein [Heracleum sosnowskyi]